MPTLKRDRLPLMFDLILLYPENPPSSLLLFDIAHLRFASIGVVVSSISCPYKHKPASNLKVSLAPKPISCAPLDTKIFANDSRQLYLSKDVHYNDVGHQIAAKEVAKYIDHLFK